MILHDTIRDTITYVQDTSSNLDVVKSIVEITNSSIGNQISMLNVSIAVFSFFFVIAGVFIGIYISNLEKRVVRIKEDIEKKEATINTLAKTVEETDKKIQSDINGLYIKLRDEESITLLKRLEEEPQDIENLGNLLLARQIKPDGFPILKAAFFKLLESGEIADRGSSDTLSYKERYLLLFLQHFMRDSMMDDIIREELRSFFPQGIICEFKRDVIKTTIDFCSVLSDNNVSFDKENILVDYLKAINNSDYSNLRDLKNILENNISSQKLLLNAINKCTQDGVSLSLFGISQPSSLKNN